MAIIRRSSELAKTVDNSVRQFLTKAIPLMAELRQPQLKTGHFSSPATHQMIEVFKEHLLDYLCAMQAAPPCSSCGYIGCDL